MVRIAVCFIIIISPKHICQIDGQNNVILASKMLCYTIFQQFFTQASIFYLAKIARQKIRYSLRLTICGKKARTLGQIGFSLSLSLFLPEERKRKGLNDPNHSCLINFLPGIESDAWCERVWLRKHKRVAGGCFCLYLTVPLHLSRI